MGKKHYGSYFDAEKQAADTAIEKAEELEVVQEEITPVVTEEESAESFVEDVATVEEKLPKRAKVIAGSGLNLRIGASVQSDVVVVMPFESVVTVEETDTAPEWYFVTTQDGKMGFALKKFIEV